MDEESLNDRLSRISTMWTLVHKAHGPSAEGVSAAQQVLMERYAGAVHRYLLGALRDPDAADDLFQEFSLRFVRGDFRNATPERGRFRYFVKTALFHLIVDYQKKRQARPLSLAGDVAGAAEDPGNSECEFTESWRDELLDRTWMALADVERRTGQPYFTVLRFRSEHPQLSSAQMADQIGDRLGKRLSPQGVRQTLHRAREKFTELLLDEVARSLENPGPERLEEEIIDLGLLPYCRSALQRRGPKH
jgi:RNA polymerase sigma-70 factor (ECF subfamily)